MDRRTCLLHTRDEVSSRVYAARRDRHAASRSPPGPNHRGEQRGTRDEGSPSNAGRATKKGSRSRKFGEYERGRRPDRSGAAARRPLRAAGLRIGKSRTAARFADPTRGTALALRWRAAEAGVGARARRSFAVDDPPRSPPGESPSTAMGFAALRAHPRDSRSPRRGAGRRPCSHCMPAVTESEGRCIDDDDSCTPTSIIQYRLRICLKGHRVEAAACRAHCGSPAEVTSSSPERPARPSPARLGCASTEGAAAADVSSPGSIAQARLAAYFPSAVGRGAWPHVRFLERTFLHEGVGIP